MAKRLADAYEPGRTKWWKILNREYPQKLGPAELFERIVAFSWQIRLRRRGELVV